MDATVFGYLVLQYKLNGVENRFSSDLPSASGTSCRSIYMSNHGVFGAVSNLNSPGSVSMKIQFQNTLPNQDNYFSKNSKVYLFNISFFIFFFIKTYNYFYNFK